MINVLRDFSEAGRVRAELFADAYHRRILDFAVSWNRTRALSGGIEIDAVAAAFPYQKATVSFSTLS
jgi:hypothetical protein